jgi:hypothetical protein
VIAGREGAITGEMRRLMVSSILTVVALLAVLGLSSGRGSASAASWKRPPGGLSSEIGASLALLAISSAGYIISVIATVAIYR